MCCTTTLKCETLKMASTGTPHDCVQKHCHCMPHTSYLPHASCCNRSNYYIFTIHVCALKCIVCECVFVWLQVDTFLIMYRAHSQRILDSVVRANFHEVGTLHSTHIIILLLLFQNKLCVSFISRKFVFVFQAFASCGSYIMCALNTHTQT